MIPKKTYWYSIKCYKKEKKWRKYFVYLEYRFIFALRLRQMADKREWLPDSIKVVQLILVQFV